MRVFNKTHFKRFSETAATTQGPFGSYLRNWWLDVTGISETQLPAKRVSRDDLKKICASKAYEDAECLAAVMAWGGLRRNHGKTLFRRKDAVLPIVKKLRRCELDHLNAYQAFHQVWCEKEPLGMGAAYFTKLIFFCTPKPNGFIMDQWTAKSVNLLTGSAIVDLSPAGYVTKKNDADTYDSFCKIVSEIADRLDTIDGPEQAELALFSKGGRKKALWRAYVTENWQHHSSTSN